MHPELLGSSESYIALCRPCLVRKERNSEAERKEITCSQKEPKAKDSDEEKGAPGAIGEKIGVGRGRPSHGNLRVIDEGNVRVIEVRPGWSPEADTAEDGEMMGGSVIELTLTDPSEMDPEKRESNGTKEILWGLTEPELNTVTGAEMEAILQELQDDPGTKELAAKPDSNEYA